MAVEAVPQYISFGGEAVVTLPKYVVFKGDNDMYLKALHTQNLEYLQFGESDIGSHLVRHEVVEVGAGTGIVMLKNLHWNKFWIRRPNWIRADTVIADPSNSDMLFEPIKVDDQRVALRCLGNNALCKRLSADRKESVLNAGASTLESFAIFRVEEPTLSRRVHSINYHLDSARIYDLLPGSLFRVTVTNPSDQPNSLQVAYAYMEKKSTSWQSGVSFTKGVTTTFQAGVPFVAEGKVEVSASVTVSGEWGGTEEKETTVTGTYTIPVQGGQAAEVTVTGVHAKCDVPFTYTQEDLHTTGQTIVTIKHDGVFSGMNTTDVKFAVRYL